MAAIRRGTAKETAMGMHERYGHISYDTLKTLPEFLKEIKEKMRCQACEQEKTTKPSSLKASLAIRTSKVLERIHIDLVGLIDPTTPTKQYRYLLVEWTTLATTH